VTGSSFLTAGDSEPSHGHLVMAEPSSNSADNIVIWMQSMTSHTTSCHHMALSDGGCIKRCKSAGSRRWIRQRTRYTAVRPSCDDTLTPLMPRTWRYLHHSVRWVRWRWRL